MKIANTKMMVIVLIILLFLFVTSNVLKQSNNPGFALDKPLVFQMQNGNNIENMLILQNSDNT